jgi:peptidylprolyl isomerase
MVVETGDIIEIRYTGWKKRNGEVFESNDDPSQPPLTMKVGSQDFIKGLNQGVLGMQEGQMKTIEIPLDMAYGQKKPELIQNLNRSQLGNIEPKVGKVLMLKQVYGGMFPAIIAAFTDSQITLDMNPPLAGEDLFFKVKLERIVKKGA